MSKYHISPSTGEVKPCKAQLSCPFETSMPHFENKQEAQKYFENIMEEKSQKSADEIKLLKEAPKDRKSDINFPEYNDKNPLQYVEDWIEGYTPN